MNEIKDLKIEELIEKAYTELLAKCPLDMEFSSREDILSWFIMNTNEKASKVSYKHNNRKMTLEMDDIVELLKNVLVLIKLKKY